MYRLTIYGIRPQDIEPVLQRQVGQGGFQSLMLKLQAQYSEQREELVLEQSDIERLHRYASGYGRGGFQDRMQILLDKLNIIKDDIANILG